MPGLFLRFVSAGSFQRFARRLRKSCINVLYLWRRDNGGDIIYIIKWEH